jgi:hypothetical protein
MLRLATCRRLPEPDPDELPLLGALAARGVVARMAAWDDPDEDWDAPAPTIIRSTWNYIHALPAFLAWSERARPLWNPPAVVRWNAHKSYLADLAAAGHPVVPTSFHARGETVDLGAVVAERGFGAIVVKPTVSAGSFGTRRFAAGELAQAQAHLDRLLEQRDAMVQAYVSSVEGYGERAVVWIDGETTHAVRKSPRFDGDDEATSGPLAVAPDERALAEAVLARRAGELLYGRVDLARDGDGRPLIMELELIEPSLFLAAHPPALARFSDALARRR